MNKCLLALLLASGALSAFAAPPIAANVIFEEVDGLVAVEAEHYFKQEKDKVRAWHFTSKHVTPNITPDADPNHADGASGGAYLEILPDTRKNHGEKLVHGENFSNQPGKLAILSYKVHFNTPGKYYVWARTHSTGTEDNGIHVGLNGEWPESGQRMQWTAKKQWFWDSKQRTDKVHTGVPHLLFLEIPKPGLHTVQFSMREDGFEFDKWLMTRDRHFKRPSDGGPKPRLKQGSLPGLAAATGTAAAVATKPNGGALTIAKKKRSGAHGDGKVVLTGELKKWHTVTVNLNGAFAHERDTGPNPFTDYRMQVSFHYNDGSPQWQEKGHTVRGYFAADGKAAQTGAEQGRVWRAHFTPDRAGEWGHKVSFWQGKDCALSIEPTGTPVRQYTHEMKTFTVGPNDKAGRDFRAQGRLEYVNKHHLQFAGSKNYFLKAGADAPETLLAFKDFDGTIQTSKKGPLKAYKSHVKDWRSGDPTWQNGKGKGLIGALNYLSGTGANAFSFLTYNAGGDGDNVWPFVERNQKFHYDCSKLDQWGMVFDHAQRKGLYLHFKLQETENDDQRRGKGKSAHVPTALDGGALGHERMLYLKEIIARYGHHLALNWNLGEENTQTPAEQKAMADYIARLDPYDSNIVIHSYPDQQDKVYTPLLGEQSALTGASLQNHWHDTHRRTVQWINASAKAGKPWVVANDEQGSASSGAPPDPGYEGFSGKAEMNGKTYDLHDIRKHVLWGNLMAGGAGVEYYFGYKLPQNDLICEDWRSRDQSWRYCNIALKFFKHAKIPFWDMANHDELVGNPTHENTTYCLGKKGGPYLVYYTHSGRPGIDLSNEDGNWRSRWFNPRDGAYSEWSPTEIGANTAAGVPPKDASQDWLLQLERVQ